MKRLVYQVLVFDLSLIYISMQLPNILQNMKIMATKYFANILYRDQKYKRNFHHKFIKRKSYKNKFIESMLHGDVL